MCDLIPLSTWGFSADVNEKLRQNKHRIVNKQLTAGMFIFRLLFVHGVTIIAHLLLLQKKRKC